MGKKAKSDHTAKQRAAEHPSLDDDANWLSLPEGLSQRIKQTSSIGLAILLMERELTQDHLPCMAQSATTGEKQWVESATWPELRLYSQTPAAGGWCVAYRKPDPSYVGNVKLFLPGWVFFVWKPAYEALWPAAGSAPVEEPLGPVDRAKVVLRALYPTKAQMPRSLKEATKAVVTKCEQRRWQPVSSDTVQRAAEQLGYRAPRKHQ